MICRFGWVRIFQMPGSRPSSRAAPSNSWSIALKMLPPPSIRAPLLLARCTPAQTRPRRRARKQAKVTRVVWGVKRAESGGEETEVEATEGTRQRAKTRRNGGNGGTNGANRVADLERDASPDVRNHPHAPTLSSNLPVFRFVSAFLRCSVFPPVASVRSVSSTSVFSDFRFAERLFQKGAVFSRLRMVSPS